MLRRIVVLAITLVALGWMIPAALGIDFLIAWCQNQEANPRLQHSFPYLTEAKKAFLVAGVWLGISVILAAQWLAGTKRKPTATASVAPTQRTDAIREL